MQGTHRLASRSIALAAALALCLSLAGCAAVAESAGKSSASAASNQMLSDTAWRLVEIQSMDDAVGSRRPRDRDLYTMHLRSDGTAAMRLDCNRAQGTWRAEPAADAASGRFTFGPLAGTRALCPPPALDERITAQAPQVRGYFLKDGRLHLSLMADGGVLVWEPANIEVPFVATADAALEAALLAATPGYTRKAVAQAGGERGAPDPARYIHSRADLNGDGRPELIVFVMGPVFCSDRGCSLMVFSEDHGRYTLVRQFADSLPPLIVSPRRTRGWSDLVRVESRRGAAPASVRYSFDGQTYVEAERTAVGSVPPAGQMLLAGELGPRVGAPLTPRD